MSVKEKLKNLPSKPGVYLFKDKNDRTLYVGKAKILRQRVRSYFQKSRPADPRLQVMINKINDLEFIVTDSEVEALILEANLVKEYKPKYNVNLKDDKSFPFIRITSENFPRVFTTRIVIKDGSTYFGPYTNVKDMKDALNTLNQLFAIRSCKYDLNPDVISKKKVKLCLDYSIKKCKGPCQGLQTKKEYSEMIEKVRRFLKGKTTNILSELQKEMTDFSSKEEYEEAARVRDKIGDLEKYRNSQKVVFEDFYDRDIFAVAQEDNDACAVIFKIREGKIIGRIHYYLSGTLYKKAREVIEYFVNQYYNNTDEIPAEIFLPEELEQKNIIEEWLSTRIKNKVKIICPKVGEKKKLLDMCTKNARYLLEELKLQRMKSKDRVPYIINSLQRDLRLSKPPRKIECFDISNIQGSDPVASMVYFYDGKPKKSEYRKFKINTKTTPDDFAMMREVIQRRYSRMLSENKDMPDLIIVDGGKGQLSSAMHVLNNLKINKQPIIGLAKRLEEIFIPDISDAQMIPKTSSSLKLIQRIRDEAHRFAITYHRQRRKKRTLVSSLDTIEGIGEKRRNLLIKTFGSIKNIKNLSIEEITEKGGIPKKVAQKIYNFFNHTSESK